MQPVHVQSLACYNSWMNQQLYAVCAELTTAERLADRGAFFKSIHGTLNHLLLGDKLWLGRFLEQSFVIASLDQELHAEFDTLTAEREATDKRIEGWAQGLTELQLAATFHYASMVNPEPRSLPMSLAVTHFFNHQTHHRGQLTTLLSQCGKDCGTTDLLGCPQALQVW